MILTTKRHGRTKRDTGNLHRHLNKQTGQLSQVVQIGNCPVNSSENALRFMEQMRNASNAEVAFHHVTISPSVALSHDQLQLAVDRVLTAYGAGDHAFVIWQHSEKSRAVPGVVDEHYHLVVSHIGPDLKALNDSHSFVKLEAVARACEVDFGEAITHSRRTKTVAAELRRQGLDYVADRLVEPDEKPQSAMSSKSRAKVERQGISLPKIKAELAKIWSQNPDPAAIIAAGFEISAGHKPGVFLLLRDGVELGACDRLLKTKRSGFVEKMEIHYERTAKSGGTEHTERVVEYVSQYEPVVAAPHTFGPAGSRERNGPAAENNGSFRADRFGPASHADDTREDDGRYQRLKSRQAAASLRKLKFTPAVDDALERLKRANERMAIDHNVDQLLSKNTRLVDRLVVVQKIRAYSTEAIDKMFDRLRALVLELELAKPVATPQPALAIQPMLQRERVVVRDPEIQKRIDELRGYRKPPKPEPLAPKPGRYDPAGPAFKM